MASDLAELEIYVYQNRISMYLDVSAFALYVVDCLLTFPDEVRYIWNSQWSAVNVLYLVTRYLAFTDGVIGLFYDFYSKLSPEACNQLRTSQSWFIVVGMFVAEAVMALRMFALYRRDSQVVQFILLGVGLAVVSGSTVSIALYHGGFVQSFIPEFSPCLMISSKNEEWIGFLLLAVYEVVLLIFTMIKIGARVPTMSIMYIFYRDGLIYFSVSLASSIINIAFLLRFWINIISLQRVLHSSMSARIILHLRAMGADARSDQISQDLSALEYSERRVVQPSNGILTTNDFEMDEIDTT